MAMRPKKGPGGQGTQFGRFGFLVKSSISVPKTPNLTNIFKPCTRGPNGPVPKKTCYFKKAVMCPAAFKGPTGGLVAARGDSVLIGLYPQFSAGRKKTFS